MPDNHYYRVEKYKGEKMGAPERFQVDFVKYIGFGIGIDTFPYDLFIMIDLPFISISIGLGKPYTDK